MHLKAELLLVVGLEVHSWLETIADKTINHQMNDPCGKTMLLTAVGSRMNFEPHLLNQHGSWPFTIYNLMTAELQINYCVDPVVRLLVIFPVVFWSFSPLRIIVLMTLEHKQASAVNRMSISLIPHLAVLLECTTIQMMPVKEVLQLT